MVRFLNAFLILIFLFIFLMTDMSRDCIGNWSNSLSSFFDDSI